MRRLLLGTLLVGLLAASGCRSAAPLLTGTPQEAVSFTVISDTLSPDPAMVALVAPYAETLNAEMGEVIGVANGEIREGRPEGPLGTFAAEAMLSVVRRLTDRPVDMALTNNGGLRVPLGPGPVTVGRMFELMPFENMLIVLELTAAQVDTLANQLADVGGDPIAGFSFVIQGDTATDVRVAGLPLDADRTYRLVTSDYLANGGGPYEVLWGVTGREELPYLLRDAFIEHLRAIGTIEPVTGGLIRRNP